MLALANRQPPKVAVVPPPKATHSAGREHARHAAAAPPATPPIPPKPLWPVHTAYPEAGAILPFHRIVAYYGNFSSTQMGILGQYPPGEMLAKLQNVVAEWAAADPSTPVIPALDYIATTAQAAAGKDGQYRLRMPSSQLDKAVHMADQVNGLVFFDVQPGWSSLAAELPPLESYMKQANVELALDPEFALVPGRRPGAWRGTMSAADINFAAQWLAKIVIANHLPPKILVVHRFTQAMVTGASAIRPLPQVEIVMDMDGFGSPSMKISAYRAFIARQPVQFTGFKLFYHNDVKWGGRVMTPADILALSPQPSYIVYQ
ncbi:MAG TPA: hypothetical protein VNF74_08075 [Terriglobales bacterium]|nr:hypothetical protein [Terriglobales bacterium]